MKILVLKLIASSLFLVSFLAVGCNPSHSHPKDVDYSLLRQKIIEQVTNGTMKEDSTGELPLPEELKAASVGGIAFVSRDQAAGLLILFLNTAPTPGSKEHGILYSTGDVSIGSPIVVVGGMQWHIDRSVEQHVWTVTRM